jgi:DinB superfamily
MSTVEGEDLRGARYVDCQLDGAEFREVTLVGARFIGSVMIDVEIDALVRNLTVNGVDVVPLVEAELDRRHPERLALRPTDVAGVLAALDVVDDFWAPTIERVRGLPEELRYERVRGEWSFIETLRHLVHVYDGWFGRAVLGEAEPFNPLGLTASFLDPADFGIDPALRPSLDDVLAARYDRQQQVREHVRALDDEGLAATIPAHGILGFPPEGERSTLDCLRVIFDEEWAHHGFAVRDLAELET